MSTLLIIGMAICLWLAVGVLAFGSTKGIPDWLQTMGWQHSILFIALWPYVIWKWHRAEDMTMIINVAQWSLRKLERWEKKYDDWKERNKEM